ncbi:unnamed protein product [Coccothraustes coccothraustes]
MGAYPDARLRAEQRQICGGGECQRLTLRYQGFAAALGAADITLSTSRRHVSVRPACTVIRGSARSVVRL